MNDHIVEFLIDYYSESIEWYKQKEIPDKFKADRWITDENLIKVNFANYIESLLMDVDSNLISYDHIINCTQDFYYCCVHNHKILLREFQKRDPVFNTLFIDCMYEIDDIGEKYCNTSRQLIDLLIGLILRPHSIYEEFENLSYCSWNHFCISDLHRHESISNYLYRCLKYPNNSECLDTIIEGLGYQQNLKFLEVVDQYLYPEPQVKSNWERMNTDIQGSAIEYLKNIEAQDSIDKLKSLESSKKLFEENRPYIVTALRNLTNGENGLLELFNTTDDWEIKHEIVEYYEKYRSKKFATFLINCLSDDTKLENGYYPIRNNSHDHLAAEEYVKLINWFGIDVIEKIDNAVLEDDENL